MSEVVISVENLSKKFCRSLKRSLLYGFMDLSRSMLGIPYDQTVLRKGEFWSTKDVSFELEKGGSLGIIGRNGSGKTTLLRILNGIFPPDKGKVTVRGKMGALIAVGAGFHPHMTGRENIYLNGTILGMSREQIDQKFDEIIKFADIGEFIDAPVSTYSSGMTVRLGFAIAIHSDPEILLADEILAVGDLPFVLKCYRKISEFRESGGTIVLVSHNIQLVRNTCSQVLWMDQGIVKAYGSSGDVCDKFEQDMMSISSEQSGDGVIIHNDPRIAITGLDFIDKDGNVTAEFNQSDPFVARIHFDFGREMINPIFTFTVTNPENIQVISNYTNFDGVTFDRLLGKGYVDFKIEELNLKPSTYACTLTLTEKGDINYNLDWHDRAYHFDVKSVGHNSYGLINPRPKWNLVTN